MTLVSEVVRIVGKDLRVARWPLATWGTLLVLSTLRGLDVLPALHDLLYPVAWIVPMMAAALVAYVVTLDPPVEGPTFWGVHRQRPMAVAGAKALFGLLLLVAMVVGHAVVLASHGLSPFQVLVMAADAARNAAAWLLFSAALAACARDAKGWLIGGALSGTLAILLWYVVGNEYGVAPAWSLTPASAACVLLAMSGVVLVWTYRAHVTGLRSGARNAMLIAVPAVIPMARPAALPDPRVQPSVRTDASITVHADRIVSRIDRRAVVVEVPVTYPDSSVVAAATVAWRLQLRDGTAIHLLPGGARVRRSATLLEPEDNVALWGQGPITRTLEFRYPLDSATLARVDGNLAQVTLALETDRVVMHRIAAFSATAGGTVAFDGTRLRVGALHDGMLATSVSHVWVPEDVSRMPWRAAYVARQILAVQAMPDGPMRVLTAQARGVDGHATRSGSWVLPGNEMRGAAAVLVPAGTAVQASDRIVAFTGEYGGRIERAIFAPAVR